MRPLNRTSHGYAFHQDLRKSPVADIAVEAKLELTATIENAVDSAIGSLV